MNVLRRVRPGRWSNWPVRDDQLVQVTARTGTRNWGSETLKVYLDGVEVGKIETGLHTPRVPIAPGRRIGKDLAERRVWWLESAHRMKYQQLADAVGEVLRDHVAKMSPPADTVEPPTKEGTA